MIWNYAYTPTIWPSVFTVLLLIALAVYSGRRRGVAGALPFMIGCLFAALWTTGSVMEIAAVDLGTKIFWFKFQGACQLPLATIITCFVLEYAWPGRWLKRRNLALLSILSLLCLGLILTNNLHQLLWRGFVYEGRLIPLRGPANLLLILFGNGLAILNFMVFAWLFRRSPQHRWPVAIMLTGLVGGRALYALEAARVLPTALPFDVPPVTFEFLLYAIALFGFRIFDPLPLARQTAIQQLHAGMLVLDPEGRLVSLNPAAERILGATARQIKGKPVRELLPAYSGVQLAEAGEAEIELSLLEVPGQAGKAGQSLRHYILAVSALKDWRGLEVGRLLLLQDVTGQKRAQAQIVEQQRALAMLHEREQLARELHDSLGQVLGYAGFQVDAASKLIQDGQAGPAAAQLERLAEVVREAHADVREHILNLGAAPAPGQPFLSVLRHYLEGFTHNYGIQTLLNVDERLGEDLFPPDERMQVLRILQEALSNTRKHGQAHCVQVTFALEGQLIRMTIQDDGSGFDPSQAAGEGHFGLRFMRERAEALGGVLQVDSTPGQGTRVVFSVPGNLGQLRKAINE